MNWQQALVSAIVIAVVCCAVMWYLEDFRQEKMIQDFKAALDQLPTFGSENT